MLPLIITILTILTGITYSYFKFRVKNGEKIRVKSVRTLICIGSGGHTAEMMRILRKMDREKYTPRLYILAGDDTTSEVKILDFENCKTGQFSISKIYRSRKVGQNYFGSIFTTLYAFYTSIPVVMRFKPDAVICNGPGTCVPVCVLILLMKFLHLTVCKIVFVESVCRVKSLSLSGKILLYFADVFAVQWEELSKTYTRARYFGRLT